MKTVHLIGMDNFEITQNDISLLNKGTKFIPCTFSNSSQALKFDTESFERVYKQMRATNIPWNRTNPTMTIPKILSDYYKKFKPRISNLSKEELNSIKTLGSNPNIIVTPSDKNLGTTLWSKSSYIQELNRQLSTSTNYSEIPTENDAKQQIKENLAKHIPHIKTNSEIVFNLVETHHKKENLLSKPLPRFYMIPKVHKNPIVGRPIVSSVDCHNTIISKLLNARLILLIRLLRRESDNPQSRFYKRIFISESADESQFRIMQCYERAGLPHRNYANMKSMDFTSLYTELEHSDIINAMINMLEYGRSIDNSMFNPQHNKATLHMLQIVLGTTYFKVPELDKFYHQKKGIPMGTNAAPNIANLTLCYYELEWTSHDQDALGKLRNNKLHLERYIDDIFTIHFHRVNEGRRGQLQKYIRNLKRYYPKSLILNDASTDSFLDIKFFFSPQNDESEPFRIETTTHQKELNLYQYTRKDSCAAPGVVKGLIHGELIRYAKRCSTFELWVGIRDRFKERLHNRGYSYKFINKCMKHLNYFTLKRKYPLNSTSIEVKIERARSQLFLHEQKPPPVWRVVFKGTDNHIPYRKILNHVCEGITFVNDPSKVIICNIRMPTIIELLRAFQKKIEFFKYLNPDCTQQQIDTQFYKFIANKFLALKRGTHLNKITQRRVGGKDLLEDLKPPSTPANPPTPLILRLLTQTKPNHQPSNNPGSSQPPDDILGRITRLGTELTPPRKRVERPQASSSETPSSIPSNRKKKKKSSNEEKKRTLKQKCIDSFFTKSNSNNQNSDDSDDSGGGNSKKSTKLNQ